MKISIVSPVYKGENIILELVTQLQNEVEKITKDYEIILVEDCGPDNSWKVIKQICQENEKVVGIKLSRNFGQHYAITAGLQSAIGEWVIVMDCDLQDRPDEIPNLYNKALEGYDLVFAQRIARQDTFFKKLSSKVFYTVFSYLTDTQQDSSVGNFGIYHNKVIDALLSMGDHIRYFPTMSRWVGFNKTYLPVKHAERAEGNSSYTLKTLLRLAFNNMIAFSEKPLWLMLKLGAFISIGSFATAIFYLFKYLMGYITEPGFSTLVLSFWFLSGIIILMLGIVGIYVGKTFERTKDRPAYIIQTVYNLHKKSNHSK